MIAEASYVLGYITGRWLFEKYLHVKKSDGRVRYGGKVVSRASVCKVLATRLSIKDDYQITNKRSASLFAFPEERKQPLYGRSY